jgi:predicted RNase H-like nuclease
MTDDARKLDVAFARFEGTVMAELKNISHDLKGVNMRMDAQEQVYVTRREVDERRVTIDERLTKVEDNQNWAARSLITGAIGLLATAAMAAKALINAPVVPH